jgi:large subunit ribosomal protein L10
VVKMAHVAEWKKDRVDALTNAIKGRSVVGIVDIHGIPAKQLQVMRGRLRGNVDLHVTKRSLINLALEKASEERPGLDGLKESVEGQVGLVLTDVNPFKLFKLMEGTKTRSPARGGELATEDIVVTAGETSFKPGPVVREFQKVGIPAAIERGKVVIKKNSVLVKVGEPIPKDLATVLPRLDILPLMVGLDLHAAYEEGTLYTPDVLDVDVGAILAQVASGAAAAFNLAVNASIFNAATIRPLLAKGQAFAFNLAVEAGIMTPETVKPILARAYGRAMALASRIPDALDDELRGRLAGAAAAAPEPAQEDAVEASAKEGDKDEEDEEEEVSEEDAAAGLSSLFG